MVTTFDDDERSTSGSRPIDLYVIQTPTETFRLTSHMFDVVFGSDRYTATTMSRSDETLAQDMTGNEMAILLPISHPFIQRYASFGIPEHDVVVSQMRLQERSWTAELQWSGFAQSMSFDESTATIRVPSTTDDALKIRLPVFAAQRLCNHVLYDDQCTVNRFSGFTESATIISIDGSAIISNVAQSGSNSPYRFGEVVHHRTGQRRLIVDQVGVTLYLNMPLVDAVSGEEFSASFGCDHSVTMCRDVFRNRVNMGGHPQMNSAFNPWLPKGLGIVQQA